MAKTGYKIIRDGTQTMSKLLHLRTGHKGDMFFAVQRAHDPHKGERIYTRQVFYNQDACIKYIKEANKGVRDD